jgi:electron transfer flavoprotein alpha subunit
MSVLVVAEHERGELRPVTLELITAAKGLGGPVEVAVIARDPSAFTDAVNVEGVDEILAVRVDAEEFESDVHQNAVEQLVAGGARSCSSVSPSARCGLRSLQAGSGFASDVLAAPGRQYGGGTALLQRQGQRRGGFGPRPRGSPPRPTAWPPAEGAGSAGVTEIGVAPVTSRARHAGWVEVQAGDVDITTADFLLSVGRGIGDKENLDQFQELADAMGATLSSSRPLVDAGWMPSARQVGQSGKTVKPGLPRPQDLRRHSHLE